MPRLILWIRRSIQGPPEALPSFPQGTAENTFALPSAATRFGSGDLARFSTRLDPCTFSARIARLQAIDLKADAITANGPGPLPQEPSQGRSVPIHRVNQEELMGRSVYEARWLLAPVFDLFVVVAATGLLN
ncbi:hypothetical protein [Mesorhizobium sp.]|uniref:hypothetical protein n=1 Tax=Mesorhizobium sp. TaxID=1871066 RepID=UPI0025CBA6D7|nr:hypothetical protein [Mesorhizobium sp.]